MSCSNNSCSFMQASIDGCCNWGCNNCGCNSCNGNWAIQPFYANQARFSCAESQNGATLVIHKIVLDPCCNPSCSPRTFNIRITGPSYPNGEVFQMRAGSCLELDEPLVITGLEPGTYSIEEVFNCPNEYITTITGPVCGRCVTLTRSCAPTVVTLVNRKRLCSLCRGAGCGCGFCSVCGNS